ncbi:MAG: hypothetical protein M1840_003367 [Geoglossum simile]|nr:MAG: hypothetical protein M1840_003367 [Geoglossum simile]
MNIQDIMNPKPEEGGLEGADLETAVGEGYLIVNSNRPIPANLVSAALAELNLSLPKQSNQWGIYGVNGDQNCELLFEEGFDFPDNRFLTFLLGEPYTAEAVYLKRNFITVYNPEPLSRVRAGENNVLIWRPFHKALDAQNGLFRIVKRSQGMERAQVDKAGVVEIKLEPGQALILTGELWIEWPQNGGDGIGQYMLIRKSPKPDTKNI